jgi:hypothetical protein
MYTINLVIKKLKKRKKEKKKENNCAASKSIGKLTLQQLLSL